MIESIAAIDDVRFLFQKLEQVHYNPYLHIPKDSLLQKINLTTTSWQEKDSIPKAEFLLGMMKLLSLVEDGHTKIIWYANEVLPKRDSIGFFPMKMGFNQNKELCLFDSTSSIQNDKIVESINGLDAQQLYVDALKCLSGNFEFKNEIAANLFFPIFLYLKGISAPYSIKVETKELMKVDSSKMISFIDLYQRMQPHQSNYELELLEKEKIALIHYNSCTGYDAFKKFLQSTFHAIEKKGIKDLIIDIRNNSGGNSSLNDLLIAYISDKAYRQTSKRLWKISDVSLKELTSRGMDEHYGNDFAIKYRLENNPKILSFGDGEPPRKADKVDNFFSGQTYVLIGTKTYSSANMFADAVSTYDLCTLVGVPTGERTNDFGEQKTEVLPKSKIPFDFTIAYDIGANGDETSIKIVEPDVLAEGDALKHTIQLILKNRGIAKK